MSSDSRIACILHTPEEKPGLSSCRVLFCWYHLYTVGGVETDMWLLARHLPACGIEPCFLQMSWEGALSERFSAFKETILTVPYTGYVNAGSCHRRWARAVADLQPNVLVFNDRFGWEMLPWLPAGIPITAIFHIFDQAGGFRQRIRKHASRIACIVANSEVTADKLRSELPEAAKKIRVIHCGIDVPSWDSCVKPDIRKKVNIVYIGRLIQEQKRALNLVPFVNRLRDLLPGRFHLSIAGDGPDSIRLENEFKPFLGDAVSITGAIGPNAVSELQRRAHFWISFSTYEGIPMSLREALAAGAVPVTTRADGVPGAFLTEGVNARFFPMDKPEHAADIIRELADDPERWQRMSLAARRLGEQRDGPAMARDYAETFREIQCSDNINKSGDREASSLVQRMSAIQREVDQDVRRTVCCWELQDKALSERAAGHGLRALCLFFKSMLVNPRALMTRRSMGCVRRLLMRPSPAT